MKWASGADDSRIAYDVVGEGPALFLGYPFTASAGNGAGAPADRRERFVEPLAERFQVVVADYPRGVGRTPDVRASLMTRDTVVDDMLAVADAADVEHFAWWGYSWGAINGLSLATRSGRITALVVGGWPPLATDFTPLQAMSAGAEQAMAELEGVPPEQRELVAGFRVFYDDVISHGWPTTELRALAMPRLCYVGDADVVAQGGVELEVTRPFLESQEELRALGWETVVLSGGLDHVDAMISADAIVPVVTEFLLRHLGS